MPEAPFVAQMRKGKAVLVNRTPESFNTLTSGCVVEQGGSVHVLQQLFGLDLFDSQWGPGAVVEGLLRDLNNIDWYVANQERVIGRTGVITRCPSGAKFALIAASLRDGHRWVADGTKWTR